MLQECLDLGMDGMTSKDGISLGQLTVSVVFRPVDSVANYGMYIVNVCFVFVVYAPPSPLLVTRSTSYITLFMCVSRKYAHPLFCTLFARE